MAWSLKKKLITFSFIFDCKSIGQSFSGPSEKNLSLSAERDWDFPGGFFYGE